MDFVSQNILLNEKNYVHVSNVEYIGINASIAISACNRFYRTLRWLHECT